MRLPLFLILFVISYGKLEARIDTLITIDFNRYFQTYMGGSAGIYFGNVDQYTKSGGSFDMGFSDGKDSRLWGINLNLMMSNKLKEFTIPEGYEHYRNPGLVTFGFYYGFITPEHFNSHFQILVGLGYSWLLHRKQGEEIGGYRGITPTLEFARVIRIGKVRYSEFQYAGKYSSPKYDPTFRTQYIDIFICYKGLILNNEEGRGGLITIGLRYKVNDYSVSQNLKHKPIGLI